MLYRFKIQSMPQSLYLEFVVVTFKDMNWVTDKKLSFLDKKEWFGKHSVFSNPFCLIHKVLKVSKFASCPVLYSWTCEKLKFWLKGISAFFLKPSDSMKQIPKIIIFLFFSFKLWNLFAEVFLFNISYTLIMDQNAAFYIIISFPVTAVISASKLTAKV